MNLKKPKFWDFKKPNIYAYILLPIAVILQSLKLFKNKSKTELKIKTICVGNIYLGGTGKTSLSIKINRLLAKKNIKSCFIKKFYKDKIDEQKLKDFRNNFRGVRAKSIKTNFTIIEKDYEVNIFFDNQTFDLIGWQNTDIYQNFNITFLSSIRKNRVLSKNLFKIPTQN